MLSLSKASLWAISTTEMTILESLSELLHQKQDGNTADPKTQRGQERLGGKEPDKLVK